MDEAGWIAANLPDAVRALSRPQAVEELYSLLGGEPDPEHTRERLLAQVRRMKLTWQPQAGEP